jgi:hypothetical protein
VVSTYYNNFTHRINPPLKFSLPEYYTINLLAVSTKMLNIFHFSKKHMKTPIYSRSLKIGLIVGMDARKATYFF